MALTLNRGSTWISTQLGDFYAHVCMWKWKNRIQERKIFPDFFMDNLFGQYLNWLPGLSVHSFTYYSNLLYAPIYHKTNFWGSWGPGQGIWRSISHPSGTGMFWRPFKGCFLQILQPKGVFRIEFHNNTNQKAHWFWQCCSYLAFIVIKLHFLYTP